MLRGEGDAEEDPAPGNITGGSRWCLDEGGVTSALATWGDVTREGLPARGSRERVPISKYSPLWGGPGGGGDTARPIKISVLSRPIRTPALTAHSCSRSQPAGDKTVPDLQQAHKQGHCHGLRRGHCWAAIAVVEEGGGRRPAESAGPSVCVLGRRRFWRCPEDACPASLNETVRVLSFLLQAKLLCSPSRGCDLQ